MRKQSCVTKYIGLGVLLTSVMYAYPAMSKNTPFEQSLDDTQKSVWKQIKTERYLIFVVSLGISILTAMNVSKNQIVRTIVSLTATTLLYKMYPKSTYMKDHVSSDQMTLMQQKPGNMLYIYLMGMVWVAAIALFNYRL